MKQPLFSFNRGRVSRYALARTDQKRVALSAETMTNWIPRIMGPMSLRPGLGYITSTYANSAAKYLKFIFSATDAAMIELTANIMRVLVDDALITRESVSSAVANGTFATDVASWTDNDESGAASVWVTGGYLGLTGTGTNAAIRDQVVTVAAPDQNVEHALRIVIERGPVYLRVGTAAGDDSYIREALLDTGTHSLAFTPTGDFNVRFFSRLKRQVLVDSCTVESSGVMTLPTNWAASDLDYVRYDQSGDVLFVACREQQQQRIERRATRSWSVVRYASDDGPMMVENVGPITITPSAISGNITLTASAALFRSTNVDSLYSITSEGQTVTKAVAAENDFSSTIRVTGVGSARTFTIVVDDQPDAQPITNAVNNGVGLIRITCVAHGGSTGQSWVIAGVGGTVEANGTWTITVIDVDTFDLQGSAFVNPYTAGGTATGPRAATTTLQRSLDSDAGPWSDVSGKSWTADTTETFADGLDNQIVWYRIGVKTGNFISGVVDVSLSIRIGSITGVARVTGYTSDTVVSAEVLTDLGGTAATDIWAESFWSDRRGWPSAVSLFDGRLWWFGKDYMFGSISDSFDSFDPNYEGDAGPIIRSIGQGPVDTPNWSLSLQRLLIGGESAEYSMRSSSLDEPLTPTNAGVRRASTQGSNAVQAIAIDQRGIYVNRGGTRVYELAFDGNSYDYASVDLTTLIPEMGDPGIVRMDVQRQPDTRIHCVRSDGTVALAVFDRAEEVLGWVDIETDGTVEDVVVMPGSGIEDEVYYVVNRTINGSTVRYLEKWAPGSSCIGGTLNKQADAFVTFTNSPASATVTGLTHLVGESVVVWADGKCLADSAGEIATFTVSASGTITLTNRGSSYSATTGVVGLQYTAQWKSSRLMNQPDSLGKLAEIIANEKRIPSVALALADTHHKGLKYGQSFDRLDPMPDIESGTSVTVDTVHSDYLEGPVSFPGQWLVDARLCLQAQAPRPCTVLSAIPEVDIG